MSPPELRPVYCAKACVRDWPRRERRNSARWRKVGQVYAERSRIDPRIWICLGCGAKVGRP